MTEDPPETTEMRKAPLFLPAFLGALNLLFLCACVLLAWAAEDPHAWTILFLANVFIVISPLALAAGAVIGAVLSRKRGRRSLWGFGGPGLTAASLVLAVTLWLVTEHLQERGLSATRSSSPFPAMTLEQLAQAVKGPDPLKRLEAAAELVQRDAPGAGGLIRPLLAEKDEHHRMQIVRLLEDPSLGVLAAEALGRMGRKDAAGPLIRALQEAGDRNSHEDAARIASALRRLTGRDFGTDANRWRAWLDGREKVDKNV